MKTTSTTMEHPFPWRALCRCCGKLLHTVDGKGKEFRDSDGTNDCLAAKIVNGKPGDHIPRYVMSLNGYVYV